MAQLDNDGQPKYVDGVYVSKPNKDFVVAKVRMKVNEFQDYINLPVVKEQIAKNSGNLNMDILISKKGNWYMPHSKFIAEKKLQLMIKIQIDNWMIMVMIIHLQKTRL